MNIGKLIRGASSLLSKSGSRRSGRRPATQTRTTTHRSSSAESDLARGAVKMAKKKL